MKKRKLIFLLATLPFFLPTVANAGDIDVQAGNVRINTSREGSLYLNSGQTRLFVPSTRSNFSRHNFRSWNRNRNNSQSIQMYCTGQNSYSQQTTQIYGNRRRVVQSNVQIHKCP